jgi:hypothetical protein
MRTLLSIVLLFAGFAFACHATDIIITDANTFKPIKNSWQSIQSADTPVYDDGSGPFYGVFEINFGLDKTQYFGNIKVEVQVNKNNEGWKKVAEVTPPAKPSTGDWKCRLYWNSRAAAFDWTTADANGFKTNLKIKFKVIEQ